MTAATQHKTIKPLFTRHCPFTATQPYCVCVCVCVCLCVQILWPMLACVFYRCPSKQKESLLCAGTSLHPAVWLFGFRRLHSASVAGTSFSGWSLHSLATPPPRSPTKHSSNFQTDRLPTGLPSGRAHTGFRLSSLQASASKRTTVYEGRFGHMTWEYVEWNVSAPTPSANTFTLNHKVEIWPLDVKKRWPMRSIKIQVWDTELQYGSTTLCLYYIIYYIFRWYFILYITFHKSCN